MTVCSRSCASSLLALSAAALLFAGCGGGRSPTEVRQTFTAEGLPLVEVDLASLPKPTTSRAWGPPADLGAYLSHLAREPRWPLALFTPGDDHGAVVAVAVFRSAADAERERRLTGQGATRTRMERVSRVGAVVVYWDPMAPPPAREALERALDALR